MALGVKKKNPKHSGYISDKLLPSVTTGDCGRLYFTFKFCESNSEISKIIYLSCTFSKNV